MPTVLRVFGTIWIIHTRDHGYPHVTVYRGAPNNFEAMAKIRVDEVEIIESVGFDFRSLNKLLYVATLHQEYLLKKWKVYHENK